MKIVGTKWVLAKKRSECGNEFRLKALLVELFIQHFGIDLFESCAAVAKMNSIRVLLSICTAFGYVIEQLTLKLHIECRS